MNLLGVSDILYISYFLAIVFVLNTQYTRILQFYFQGLIQQNPFFRYQVIKKLGQGGFGITYLAEDRENNDNLVVIKKFFPQQCEPYIKEIGLRLFRNEIKAQKNLGHFPKIPTFLDSYENCDGFFLVQEFIDGHTLDQEISLGVQLDQNYVSQLIFELLEILVFIHEKNIVHRDIKPSNIMRRKIDQKLVLIDFGAIKIIDMTLKTGIVSEAIGTSGYMPIEQALGKPKFSSDIYSLGIVGIEALTGQRIYELSENSKVGKLEWEKYCNVTKEFSNFINKMTFSDYNLRYQTAYQALRDLKAINSNSKLIKLGNKLSKLIEYKLSFNKTISLLLIVILCSIILRQNIDITNILEKKIQIDKIQLFD